MKTHFLFFIYFLILFMYGECPINKRDLGLNNSFFSLKLE